ncbi:hypothetical protein QUF90_05225 [Desulfococcaceae bacterium HSG9]|nr:hypothetical protein [Desulfococcaceae bacterium HSG9]
MTNVNSRSTFQMIKYFTNRELSQKLEIKLAKWKRWSREFLLPDPLGGLQSGYARHYHPDEAFRVYLGGCLVAELKFSIPEAKRIMSDLETWLEKNGFRFNADPLEKQSAPEPAKRYLIRVFRNKNQMFWYEIRGIIADEKQIYRNIELNTELYEKTIIDYSGVQHDDSDSDVNYYKGVNITHLLINFLKRLDLSMTHYHALSAVR